MDMETTGTVESIVAKLSRLFAASLQSRMAPHGVLAGQMPVLEHLWEEDGLTQSDLCELVGVEQPTMANTIKRMERDGLVKKRRDNLDRRKFRVLLTPKARDLKPVLEASVDEVRALAVDGVDPRALRVMLGVAERMEENLRQDAEPPLVLDDLFMEVVEDSQPLTPLQDPEQSQALEQPQAPEPPQDSEHPHASEQGCPVNEGLSPAEAEGTDDLTGAGVAAVAVSLADAAGESIGEAQSETTGADAAKQAPHEQGMTAVPDVSDGGHDEAPKSDLVLESALGSESEIHAESAELPKSGSDVELETGADTEFTPTRQEGGGLEAVEMQHVPATGPEQKEEAARFSDEDEDAPGDGDEPALEFDEPVVGFDELPLEPEDVVEVLGEKALGESELADSSSASASRLEPEPGAEPEPGSETGPDELLLEVDGQDSGQDEALAELEDALLKPSAEIDGSADATASEPVPSEIAPEESFLTESTPEASAADASTPEINIKDEEPVWELDESTLVLDESDVVPDEAGLIPDEPNALKEPDMDSDESGEVFEEYDDEFEDVDEDVFYTEADGEDGVEADFSSFDNLSLVVPGRVRRNPGPVSGASAAASDGNMPEAAPVAVSPFVSDEDDGEPLLELSPDDAVVVDDAFAESNPPESLPKSSSDNSARVSPDAGNDVLELGEEREQGDYSAAEAVPDYGAGEFKTVPVQEFSDDDWGDFGPESDLNEPVVRISGPGYSQGDDGYGEYPQRPVANRAAEYGPDEDDGEGGGERVEEGWSEDRNDDRSDDRSYDPENTGTLDLLLEFEPPRQSSKSPKSSEPSVQASGDLAGAAQGSDGSDEGYLDSLLLGDESGDGEAGLSDASGEKSFDGGVLSAQTLDESDDADISHDTAPAVDAGADADNEAEIAPAVGGEVIGEADAGSIKGQSAQGGNIRTAQELLNSLAAHKQSGDSPMASPDVELGADLDVELDFESGLTAMFDLDAGSEGLDLEGGSGPAFVDGEDEDTEGDIEFRPDEEFAGDEFPDSRDEQKPEVDDAALERELVALAVLEQLGDDFGLDPEPIQPSGGEPDEAVSDTRPESPVPQGPVTGDAVEESDDDDESLLILSDSLRLEE